MAGRNTGKMVNIITGYHLSLVTRKPVFGGGGL